MDSYFLLYSNINIYTGKICVCEKNIKKYKINVPRILIFYSPKNIPGNA